MVFILYSVVLSDSISSIGLGGGVVPIVQPIHAPIAKTATKAINTGIATSQNWTADVSPKSIIGFTIGSYAKSATMYPTMTTAQTINIIHPIA
jgi:hypothetical protein